MKKQKSQFKINDRVVVTDSGECFTGYSQMFDELGFKKLDSNPGFEEGTSARIFGMREHPHSDCFLIALVDDEGNECLTSNLGVVLVEDKAQIKINDLIRITNPGKTYTTHPEMFIKLGFANKYENSAWNRGEIGRVFGISTRDYDNKIVYAVVHADGSECLISAAGIELVNESAADNTQINSIIARLSKIESQLDPLATALNKPAKSQTAVEWLIDELKSFDTYDDDEYYDICLSVPKMVEITTKALEMEKQQNSK